MAVARSPAWKKDVENNYCVSNYQPAAAKMQELAQDYGITVVFMPAGPLLEYNPDKVKQAPTTPAELLAWCKANPNKLIYARPANSGGSACAPRKVVRIVTGRSPPSRRAARSQSSWPKAAGRPRLIVRKASGPRVPARRRRAGGRARLPVLPDTQRAGDGSHGRRFRAHEEPARDARVHDLDRPRRGARPIPHVRARPAAIVASHGFAGLVMLVPAFFLILGEPEAYGLPAKPEVPTIYLKSAWTSAVATGIAALIATFAAFFFFA